MNLPNKITMFRICLIPVFLFFYLASPWGEPADGIAALAVFVVASASDKLDGYIARSRGLVTNFGKLMDPLADKMLVSAAMIAMITRQALPVWAVIIMVCREFFISGFRQLALEQKIVLAASSWAKAKTAVQMVMVLFLLIPLARDGSWWWVTMIDRLLIYASVVLSVASAAEYAVKNKSLLSGR